MHASPDLNGQEAKAWMIMVMVCTVRCGFMPGSFEPPANMALRLECSSNCKKSSSKCGNLSIDFPNRSRCWPSSPSISKSISNCKCRCQCLRRHLEQRIIKASVLDIQRQSFKWRPKLLQRVDSRVIPDSV